MRRRRLWLFVLFSALAGCRGTPAESSAKEAPKKEQATSDVVLSPEALEAAHLKVQRVAVETRASTVVALGTIDFAQRRVAKVASSRSR
jgi:hypothetical protein